MSPEDKKDLTRIEDLGEFIHELNAEEEDFLPPDELPGESESFAEETPDLPVTDDEESFPTFSTPEELPEPPESSDEDPFTTFSEESSTEENTFETADFSADAIDEGPTTDDFSFTTSEKTEEVPEEDPFPASSQEEPDWMKEDEKPLEMEAEPVISEDSYTPSEFKSPETFEDIRKFSESSSFSGMAAEGNPSFSVLLKNVRFIEDINDIISLLREMNLLADSEEQTKGRLMRGMLLVPRISEYAAIYLAHKLRRFDIDIQVGLSDEIHPPKHQETPETGIVSKSSLYQNQSHLFNFDNPKLDISQIIVSATPGLEGYQVVRYMGVASEHKMLDSGLVEDENSKDVPRHYQELANKLKAHALKNHSNAVVGLNYQLTPIPGEYGISGHKYRLTCTGNLVWVNKL